MLNIGSNNTDFFISSSTGVDNDWHTIIDN